MRATVKQIESLVKAINEAVGITDSGPLVIKKGHYIYQADSGAHKLDVIVSDGGASQHELFGDTKQQLVDKLYPYLHGIYRGQK